jgi:hypothetical protein
MTQDVIKLVYLVYKRGNKTSASFAFQITVRVKYIARKHLVGTEAQMNLC